MDHTSCDVQPMTNPNIKSIHDAISEACKPAGFSKKGENWYANRIETILIINPQKSNYGQKYYLNLGAYFKMLGTKQAPKESECHLRARISQFVEEEAVEKIFDFDQPISTLDRHNEIVKLLRDEGLPFLEMCSSLQGVRDAFARNQLDSFSLLRSLKEQL